MEKFNIPRRDGWEEILEPLVIQITGAQQAYVRGGCNYDSDVFFMQPHYLGSCPCSYGQKLKEFEKTHSHSPQCFHSFYQEIDEAFKSHPKYYKYNILRTSRVNMIRQLCVKNNITYDPVKIPEICTCTFQREWEKLNVQHDEACPKILPNFWHKNSNLKIWWFKIFFRNSYANKPIQKEEFQKIVAECIQDVNKK